MRGAGVKRNSWGKLPSEVALGGLWLVWISKAVLCPRKELNCHWTNSESHRARPVGAVRTLPKRVLWPMVKHLIVAILEGRLSGLSRHTVLDLC